MKIFKADFKGIGPVGNCIVVAATNEEEASKIIGDALAGEGIKEFIVFEVDISKPCIIEFLLGGY